MGCENGVKICIVLALVAMLWGKASAQNGCTIALVSMSSCLNYISGNSSTPASSCCSALSNVVQSQPTCLCSALNGGAASSLGVTINQTRALQLPSACNVQTPPASRCNGAGGPSISAASPADSPTGSPNDEPEAPASDFPSGTGSKTIPSTQGSSSRGIITKSSLSFVLFTIGIVLSSLSSF